ncbi:hypothetical protein OF83DRAFT_581405 [Amylostereum chailletii]|nr:hypothetical protein OF83DRAFT_581405 [Amylostereum chailletii]
MAHRWAKSPRIPNSRRPVTLQNHVLHSPHSIPAQASLWINDAPTVPASFRSIHLSSGTSLRVRYRAPTSAPTGVTIHTDRNFSSSRTQTRLLSSCSDNPYEGDEDRVRVGVRQGKSSGRGKSSGGRGGGLSGGKGRGEGGFAPRGLATFAEVPQIYSPTPDQSPIVDARIAQADNLIQKLKSKRSGPERPVRPGYGSAGRAVVVRANFFPVNLSKDKFYEYNVEISPEPKSQKSHVKRRVLDLFQKSNEVSQYSSAIVHDGSQRLFAARKLPQSLSGSVGFYEKGDKGPPPNAEMYTVTVKFVKELAMGPLKRYIEGVGDVSKSEK